MVSLELPFGSSYINNMRNLETMQLREKMEKLLNALKGFSKIDVEKLESSDRQYKALKKLYNRLNNPQLFLKLVVVNALMSYQLQMKGENYWEKFSEFFSEFPKIEKFEEFIKTHNKRFLTAKLKRLGRAENCVQELFSRYSVETLGNDLTILVNELSGCLKQKKSAKTVVFTAKMFRYGYKIVFGKMAKKLEQITIPLDSRLSKISKDRSFWKKLSEESKIPQVELDALFWIPMGMSEEEIEKLPETLRNKISNLKIVLKRYML